ncbi:lytic transglycosylase domain-containing protein [Parafrankia discariae]|uniref:lytic transglycosylase domain-containing protein n=1 Tax=Parafrankia discariae TaxID=365528 RepID=UPI0003793F4F|nr:lytic murein transglycosylase [Parafrankia discariae]
MRGVLLLVVLLSGAGAGSLDISAPDASGWASPPRSEPPPSPPSPADRPGPAGRDVPATEAGTTSGPPSPSSQVLTGEVPPALSVRSGEVDGTRAIPGLVLAAYQRAAQRWAVEQPACHLRWQLLAGIGRIESDHAAGRAISTDGTITDPIIGVALDGRGGRALIRDTDGGTLDRDTRLDRAVGPMQFIPSTWRWAGRDGSGDGRRDPHNIHDAAQAAAGYLCARGRDLDVAADRRAALFSYNPSDDYVRAVLGWAEYYSGRGAPVDGPSTAQAAARGGGVDIPPEPSATGGPGPGTGARPGPVTVPAPTPTPTPTPTQRPTGPTATRSPTTGTVPTTGSEPPPSTTVPAMTVPAGSMSPSAGRPPAVPPPTSPDPASGPESVAADPDGPVPFVLDGGSGPLTVVPLTPRADSGS